jgi:hypothetical protein
MLKLQKRSFPMRVGYIENGEPERAAARELMKGKKLNENDLRPSEDLNKLFDGLSTGAFSAVIAPYRDSLNGHVHETEKAIKKQSLVQLGVAFVKEESEDKTSKPRITTYLLLKPPGKIN